MYIDNKDKYFKDRKMKMDKMLSYDEMERYPNERAIEKLLEEPFQVKYARLYGRKNCKSDEG